uniref:Protein TOPLESS n=1 Tax=Anthurium amnicola TaxID=1678845 RepID=A0A1D1XZ69_9ARAE
MKLPDSLSATKVLAKLRGHQTRIIGLAFSDVQSILVSSGADAQLIVWNIISWEKQACKFLQIPSGLLSTSPTDTRIQFHHDQLHFLVVHERLMAIYETKCLECLKEWAPREAHRLITCAAYSCDYKLIYACFNDGVICIFHPSTLSPQYSISRSTYLPLGISSCVYPTVVAAHPSIPTQFTVGLTDGDIYVLEILVSEQKTMSAPATLNSGQNIEDFDLNQ